MRSLRAAPAFHIEPLRRSEIYTLGFIAAEAINTEWETSIMAHKFAFDLADAGAPNQYAIRLVDKKQIAELALAEGFAKPIPLEPVVVLFDEGSGELLPIDGFDDTTPRGRIAIKIMRDTYDDVLDRIAARVTSDECPAGKARQCERHAN